MAVTVVGRLKVGPRAYAGRGGLNGVRAGRVGALSLARAQILVNLHRTAARARVPAVGSEGWV